jgi:alpha-2-macroglobulin
VRQFDLGPGADTGGKIGIANSGSSSLHGLISIRGVPQDGGVEAGNRYMEISVSYRNLEGEPIDISRISQGEDFLAEVAVTNPGLLGNYRRVALTQVFPSGWEIHNTRMDQSERAVVPDVPEYIDIRDDRVNQYFDLPAGRTKRFVVLLNASYAGRYHLPGPVAAVVDDETIFARTSGRWVEVVLPGE